MDLDQFLDQPQCGFFSGGEFISPISRQPIKLISPATGKFWKAIVPAYKDDVQCALQSAHLAFSDWKRLPAPQRGAYLRNIGALIQEYAEKFAWVMAMEMGKPVSQGISEARYTAGYFGWFAGEAERIYGQTIPSQFPDKRLSIHYEPIGVAAMITPWNFPLAMAGRKIAAALAAGCTAINKPAAETPMTMLLFAEICRLAQLPPGVVNILPGDAKTISQVLLDAPLVRKLSFTGSTAVGKLLFRQSADTLKKLTLELGGNAPLLVFDDADLKKAVQGTIESKFRNNGQTCVCPNRILVQAGIARAYIKALKEAVENLKCGDPFDPHVDLSPILHPSAQDKFDKHSADALQKGAHLESKSENGIVLSGIGKEMAVWSEETFGPLAPIATFNTEEEGIALANDTAFGLCAYFFTENLSRAARIAEALEAGIIGINDGVPSSYQASFGGIKSSGFGREGGPTGIKEYLNEKFISLKI